MKTIIVLIFLVVSFNLYAQENWNPIDTTDIKNLNGDQQNERIAIFANNHGIHVLKVLYNGDNRHVSYYRLKTTGDLDDGFDSSGIKLDDYGDFPNVVGDEDDIYAVYRKNDSIKVQRSTNGGSSWDTLQTQIKFRNGNVSCNGVDAAFSSDEGLHVVWSEKVGNNYESYFRRFTGTSWDDIDNITDTLEVTSGGFLQWQHLPSAIQTEHMLQ